MTGTIKLADAYKTFTLDQDKIMSPEETVRRFGERLRHLDLDILDETKRIDKGRLDIPVYFSTCGVDAESIIGTKKQMGKGATPSQAEASAVMELAERFSFFSFTKDPGNFIVDTFPNVGGQALPFDQIARSVHDDSDDLEAARFFYESLPMQWTWGYNLTRETPVLVPFTWFFAINEFNGPSAGNCIEEALSQGICEIVERHVSAIVSRKRLEVPRIDPASATDPMVKEMLDKYARAGIRLEISDFTLEMGIPSVGALAWDPSTLGSKSEIVWTAGTTPDPEKSLSRALTEVAQLAGDFNSGANYVASGLPKFKDVETAGYITGSKKLVDIATLPDISNDNIRLEVESLVASLSTRNLDVIVIDTMHTQLGIPAFYTIVPGAHFRERAMGTSVGMFTAKLIVEGSPPREAIEKLEAMNRALPGKYYLRFYLGLCHLNLGDPRTAQRFFDEALDLEPTHQDIPSIYSYKGLCLKELGEYRKALPVLEKGLSYDSDRTDLYNLLGFCYYKLKEHEKAIEQFEALLKLNPSSAIDYANIASNYREMGKTVEAIQYYELALELDPGIDFARDSLVKLIGTS